MGLYVLTGDAGVGAGDAQAGRAFGFGHGIADRFDDAWHVDDGTAADATAGGDAHAEDPAVSVRAGFTDKTMNFRGADIENDDGR